MRSIERILASIEKLKNEQRLAEDKLTRKTFMKSAVRDGKIVGTPSTRKCNLEGETYLGLIYVSHGSRSIFHSLRCLSNRTIGLRLRNAHEDLKAKVQKLVLPLVRLKLKVEMIVRALREEERVVEEMAILQLG